MKTLLLMLMLAAPQLIPTATAATVIPPERTMNWARANLGLKGGIPAAATIYTNLYFSGEQDYGDALRTALQNCPSNQTVKLWPGDYTVGGNLDYATLGNGKVLRGTGDWRTKIRLTNGFVYLRQSGFTEEALTNAVEFIADANKGDSTITISNVPSWVVVGGSYIIDQIGETNLVYGFGTSENENPASGYRETMIFSGLGKRESRGMGMMVQVTAINGNVLTLEQPITFSLRKAQSAQLAQPGINPAVSTRAARMGFEGITFEQTFNNGDTDMFRCEADECWWKDCTLTNSAGRRQIQFVFSRRCEVQNCVIVTSHAYASGQGYGIAFYHLTTSCLVENSLFGDLHSAISFDFGANNNAIAYCLETQGRSDSGQNPAFGTHGVHCYGNLAEGCYFVDKVLLDWSHGSGSHQMIFRSRVRGYDGSHVIDQVPIVIEFYNRSNSVVGCALGDAAWHTNVTRYATNDFCDATTKDIYHLGYFSFGCAYGPDNFDRPGTNATLLALNWDAVTSTNSGVVLGGFATSDLPNSLIYAAAPPYWTAGRPWPMDLLANPNAFTNLPAFDKLFSRTNNFGALVTRGTATSLRIGP